MKKLVITAIILATIVSCMSSLKAVQDNAADKVNLRAQTIERAVQ